MLEVTLGSEWLHLTLVLATLFDLPALEHAAYAEWILRLLLRGELLVYKFGPAHLSDAPVQIILVVCVRLGGDSMHAHFGLQGAQRGLRRHAAREEADGAS